MKEKIYNVFDYRVDLCFHEHKLAIEVDEFVHDSRNNGYETQRQQTVEKELDYELILMSKKILMKERL